MRRDRIGVQLYTLREHTATDMEATLRRVAEIGYTAVEFAGYGDSSAERIRSVLDASGLTAIAAHVPYEAWEQDRGGIIDDLHVLGCRYGVVPSVPSRTRSDADAVERLAGVLSAWGRELREQGLGLAYHNHDAEFAEIDGVTVWERLAMASDPEAVSFELDLYWAAYGGADPAALLHRHADRVPLLHAKDMTDVTGDGEERRDAPAGEGVLDWSGFFGAPGDEDRWYIVEQDVPDDAFADVATSLGFLERHAAS